MAIIGMSIGASFALSMVLGPVIHSMIGGAGIFWVTALLALLALLILLVQVPDPVKSRVHSDAEVVTGHLRQILGNTQLLRLDLGILVLHMILTASFVVMPLMLRDMAGLGVERHAMVYLPVFLVSAVLMVPFIIIAEKYRRMKPVFLFAIALLMLAEYGLSSWTDSLWTIVSILVLFFAAFNILEASLPSMVAKLAPADKKGTAMGVYSSSQFFGAFLGGVAGGWVHGEYGVSAVFLMSAGLLALWLLAALTMAPLPYHNSRMLHIGSMDNERAEHLSARLWALEGVTEAVLLPAEQVAYLKVDNRQLDEKGLAQILRDFGLE
jgi:predicted MFS family arabinose efflux permease